MFQVNVSNVKLKAGTYAGADVYKRPEFSKIIAGNKAHWYYVEVDHNGNAVVKMDVSGVRAIAGDPASLAAAGQKIIDVASFGGQKMQVEPVMESAGTPAAIGDALKERVAVKPGKHEVSSGDAAAAEMAEKYKGMSFADLRREAVSRGLSAGGGTAVIVDRLVESDLAS
jgi:hypothetical protein